jgi:hypothetical protein
MLRLDEMWDLFDADRVNYMIILFMVMFVLGIVASLGMLLCIVGFFFTVWWMQLVSAHMIGQLARLQEKAITW